MKIEEVLNRGCNRVEFFINNDEMAEDGSSIEDELHNRGEKRHLNRPSSEVHRNSDSDSDSDSDNGDGGEIDEKLCKKIRKGTKHRRIKSPSPITNSPPQTPLPAVNPHLINNNIDEENNITTSNNEESGRSSEVIENSELEEDDILDNNNNNNENVEDINPEDSEGNSEDNLNIFLENGMPNTNENDVNTNTNIEDENSYNNNQNGDNNNELVLNQFEEEEVENINNTNLNQQTQLEEDNTATNDDNNNQNDGNNNSEDENPNLFLETGILDSSGSNDICYDTIESASYSFSNRDYQVEIQSVNQDIEIGID